MLIPLIVACALFMENLDSSVVSTSLPEIARDLAVDPIALKLAFTAGGVPEALPFLDLGGRIVKALPDSWMTNNDDYLDTF